MKYRYFLMVGWAVAAVSCSDQNDSTGKLKPLCATKTTLALSASAPNYNDDIKSFMTSNCTSCHSTAGGKNPDLSSYTLVNAKGNLVVSQVNNNHNGSYTAEQKTMFTTWKTNSYPESAPAVPTTPNYNDHIKAYLSANCTASCHKSGSQSSDPDLTTYALAKASGANIVANVNADHKGTRASGDKTMFTNWKNAGYLESASSSTSIPTTYDYTTDIKGYLNSNCISCHGTAGTMPDLTSDANIKTNGEAIVNNIQGSHQDKTHSDSVKTKFGLWKAALYPTSTTPATTTPTTTTPATTTPTATTPTTCLQ